MKPTPKARNEHREGHNTKPETARTAEKGGHEKRRREREGKDAEQNTKRTNTETNLETKGEILEPKDEKSER